MKNAYCFRCNTKLKLEKNKDLKKTYKYYCPECDENMFSFEAVLKKDVRGGVKNDNRKK